MEEHPIKFPTTQLFVNDWKKWVNDWKNKSDTVFVRAYNLIQIWIIKILTFIYDVVLFYFVPFLIVMLVQIYGVRPISDDTTVIEAETGNSSLTLVKQNMANYNAKTDFLKYY